MRKLVLTAMFIMKQKLIFLSLLMMILGQAALFAQPVTTITGPNPFGGNTKTTVEDNGMGTRTTTEEYYDDNKPPKLREKIIRVKNRIDGDSTIRSIDISKDGDTTSVKDQTFDKDENEIYHQNIEYKFGSPKRGYRYIRLPDGTRERYNYDEKTGTFEKEKTEGGWRVKESYGKLKDKSLDLTAGYSYLSVNRDGESESFPAGAYLTLAYYLNARLALLADASLHSKKIEEYRTTLIFLMGGIQYNLWRERQRAIILYSRLLLGLALNNQKYSSGSNSASSFAFAFGLGSFLPLTDRIAVNVVADYIRTNFNNDGQNNFRAGAGIRFVLGKK